MRWASAVHELCGARSLCGAAARGGLSRANLYTVLRKARRGGRNTDQTGRCAMRWCWTVLAAHLSWIEGAALCAAVLATWATVAAGSRPRRLLWRQSSARSPNRADDAGTAVLAERSWHATRSDTNRQLPGGHLGPKETMATALSNGQQRCAAEDFVRLGPAKAVRMSAGIPPPLRRPPPPAESQVV